MFSRIREAIRIIGYREPNCEAPFVIQEHIEPPPPSVTGRRIAYLIQVAFAIYIIGRVSGPIGKELILLLPGHAVSLTVAGGTGALLMWTIDWLRNDIQTKLRLHLNLDDKLAPFFGHKLENVFRVLKG
jgi:hypothetical protein